MLTFFLIIITVGISLWAMNNQSVLGRFMFNPYAIAHRKEWWRFITGGFLHADYAHLAFNMLSLYFFGRIVEHFFLDEDLFGKGPGTAAYLGLYMGALVMSGVFTFFREKDNMYYNALGASGAVSAVVYASILLMPTSTIYIFMIPVQAWLYGLIYLVASWYMARRNVGNIGHDAHFWGAVFGFVFPLLLKPDLWYNFTLQLKVYFNMGGEIPY